MIEVKIEADLLFDWIDIFHGDGSVWRWVSVNQTNLEGRNVELPVGEKIHQKGECFALPTSWLCSLHTSSSESRISISIK